MPDVIQRGTDTSGRSIKQSREFWEAWDAICDELGFEPLIVQGGWMGSSGADASAGTHLGDAADLRLWDRTDAQRKAMIRVFRNYGFAYWERYESQGFDLHAHLVPGPWAHPAPQALAQWRSYLDGRNGLASNGPDYHVRPNPIVTQPPEDDMKPEDFDRIEAMIDRAADRIANKLEQAFGDLYPKKDDLDVTVRQAVRETWAEQNKGERKAGR